MYEASEIVTIGAAHNLILGTKPFLQSNLDSEGMLNRDERQMDMDEGDE